MQLQDLTNTNRTYTVKFDETVFVDLRHISREELRDINKKCTTTNFINHQKVEEYDATKADCLLGQAAIKGWRGVKNGEEEAPCTPGNIDILMTRHNIFSKFINDVCVDIDFMIRQEKEAERKNS